MVKVHSEIFQVLKKAKLNVETLASIPYHEVLFLYQRYYRLYNVQFRE